MCYSYSILRIFMESKDWLGWLWRHHIYRHMFSQCRLHLRLPIHVLNGSIKLTAACIDSGGYNKVCRKCGSDVAVSNLLPYVLTTNIEGDI